MTNAQQKHSKTKTNGESVGSTLARQGDCCALPIGSPSFFMNRGYFPIWRKIEDWGWYKEGNTMRVFFHLLIKANYKESHYLGVKIYPGQVVTGRKALAFSIGITERQVRTALKHLKATSEVSVKNFNKFSIITLNNWNKYTLTTSEVSEESPASDQQVTTSNNCIERKEVYNREKTPSSLKQPSSSKRKDPCLNNSFFDTLWSQYPKQVGKKAAYRHFKASVKTEQDKLDIVTALNNYKKSDRVNRGFIKDGSSWFNNWQDWIDFKEVSKEQPKNGGADKWLNSRIDN